MPHLGTVVSQEPLVFVMLNPSTADDSKDDPTIRRCIEFARSEGCGQLFVVNLFAARATNPRDLWGMVDPVGPGNDAAIGEALKLGTAVAAWGAVRRPQALIRARHVVGSFRVRWRCLGLNSDGSPRHPLYVPASTPLSPWNPKKWSP